MPRSSQPAGQKYDERELVRAAQRGDRESFARLYEANVERVYRYLMARMGQPADAEDITAEVFIRAMTKISSYRPGDVPFIAWLIRIAHNLAINQLKKSTRRRETALFEDHAFSDDPSEEAIRDEATRQVSSSLQELTELQRHVVHLRFGADLSLRETARAIGRSEGAVKNLQYKALRTLRQVLHSREVLGYEG